MNKLYLIINGSRTFSDYGLFRDKCNYYLQNYLKFDTSKHRYNPNIEIISGCARGPDSMAIDYAIHNFIQYKEFPAMWDDLEAVPCKIKTNKFGKEYNVLAGRNRNEAMMNYVKCKPKNGLLSFFDGSSTGTLHMQKICRDGGIPVRVVMI